ncbi:MAG: exodeoxyribonuclease VII small subunit [Verrucomicrobiales bacterium]|jgi:exodeoxyribonuclease VII small subunit|nr:exodeoxyribonuclease VII small subunit [Verrucomicrobiales bacterium]MBP9225692.1 exodeoxyribonuclease VII small subunit [Verrucomicrobiales bacterium]HQZ29621.1 exodeoxyribonuclease VII small subunit [Verrucomicrobiales bacterium]
MPKAADKKKTETSELPFEQALEQLEELVREMEYDEIPLEDLIKNYEEGTRLFRVCEKRLDEAQGRIEIIRKKRNGESVLENFSDDADATSRSADSADDSQKNGELF